jgi:Phospholipase_D-nuclease N-terminal
MNDNVPITPAAPQLRRAPSRAQARAGGQGIINLINLVLIILTIRDIRRRRDDEINGKRKWWMLAAFAPPIGPIAYFIFGRKRGVQTTEIPLETIEEP